MSAAAVSDPRACPECLRRARLLALLAPYIEKVATGAPGSRSPELLRLSNEDLVAAVAPRAEEEILEAVEGASRAQPRDRPGRGGVLGLLPSRQALPGGAARRRRRALGADRARRPGAAERDRRPGGSGHAGRGAAGELLRARGGTDARPRSGGGRDGRRQRPRLRGRRLRAPRRSGNRADGGGARLRAGRRLPGRSPLALAPGGRAGPRPLRAAAGNRRLALDVPGAQPGDGRPGRE